MIDNPQAFPFNQGNSQLPSCDGMTLLDYFAGQALTGMMQDRHNQANAITAEICYELDIHMLHARSAALAQLEKGSETRGN